MNDDRVHKPQSSANKYFELAMIFLLFYNILIVSIHGTHMVVESLSQLGCRTRRFKHQSHHKYTTSSSTPSILKGIGVKRIPYFGHHLFMIQTDNRDKAQFSSGETDHEYDYVANDDGSSKTAYPNLSIIGICGSIGSGKSYTSSLLVSKLNALVASRNQDDGNDENTNNYAETKIDQDQIAFHIDTDSLAHGVYAPGSLALKEIEQEFGKEVIREDGTVDRKALGGIVFSDENQMAKLEQIVWPHVKSLLLDRLDEIKNNNTSNSSLQSLSNQKIVVVEAAVLLDANWDDNQLFDAIWVVRSSTQISAERLVQNRGMDRADALKRMEAQVTRRGIGNLDQEIKNGSVTAVIENYGSISNGTDDESADSNGDGSDQLWNTIRQCLTDPNSWKEGRCPQNILEDIL